MPLPKPPAPVRLPRAPQVLPPLQGARVRRQEAGPVVAARGAGSAPEAVQLHEVGVRGRVPGVQGTVLCMKAHVMNLLALAWPLDAETGSLRVLISDTNCNSQTKWCRTCQHRLRHTVALLGCLRVSTTITF